MNRKLWIIVKEVYRKNVMSPAFFFMVFGPLIMFAIIAGVSYLIAQDQISSRQGTVAIIASTPQVQQVIEADGGENQYRFDLPNEQEAKRALAAGTIDGYIVMDVKEDAISTTYYREKTGKDISLMRLENTLENYLKNNKLESIGLTTAQLSYVQNNRVNMKTVNLELTEEGEVKEAKTEDWTYFVNKGIAYVMAMVVFIFIMNYVSVIAQEIATEKGSRIMEIVLSSVSATTHFFGKMLGIALVILTQFGIYLVMGFAIYHAVMYFNAWNLIPASLGITEMIVKQILSMVGSTVWLTMIYAIIGIITYSCIAGFLGSLVTKVEDIQKTVLPITLLGVAGFYIGMYATASSNNPVVRIGSHIPFFTPFVMPHRIAAETVSESEIWLSIIISLIFAVVCLVVSTALYKGSVLLYSDKGIMKKVQQSFQLFMDTKRSQTKE